MSYMLKVNTIKEVDLELVISYTIAGALSDGFLFMCFQGGIDRLI